MGIDIEHIHIGEEINKRRQELGISKSELGRRINVPQQHINRILAKDTIDTGKLLDISSALDKNFFDLYFSERKNQLPTYLAAVPTNGNVKNTIKDSEIESELAQSKILLEEKDKTIKLLQDEIIRLKDTVKDKALIISFYQEKIGDNINK